MLNSGEPHALVNLFDSSLRVWGYININMSRLTNDYLTKRQYTVDILSDMQNIKILANTDREISNLRGVMEKKNNEFLVVICFSVISEYRTI